MFPSASNALKMLNRCNNMTALKHILTSLTFWPRKLPSPPTQFLLCRHLEWKFLLTGPHPPSLSHNLRSVFKSPRKIVKERREERRIVYRKKRTKRSRVTRAQPGTLGSTTGLYLHWRGGLKQTEYQHCRLFKWGGMAGREEVWERTSKKKRKWRMESRGKGWWGGTHTRLWKNGGNAE